MIRCQTSIRSLIAAAAIMVAGVPVAAQKTPPSCVQIEVSPQKPLESGCVTLDQWNNDPETKGQVPPGWELVKDKPSESWLTGPEKFWLTFAAAWLTHVIWALATMSSSTAATWGQIIVGIGAAVVFPIGALHGVVIWVRLLWGGYRYAVPAG